MNFEMLINRNHLLDETFIPDDLMITDNNENNFHQFSNPNLKPMISKSIFPYFLKMQQDMKKLGLHIIIDSGYRSYDYQKDIFQRKIKELGIEKATNLVALPGSSEHQSGLAFDIAIIRNGVYCKSSKPEDKEIIWLMENSYKYGFILRYPKGKENITGYSFEPWHYRYVGTRLSNLLNKFEITLEEYYEQKQEYDDINKNYYPIKHLKK